MLLNSETIQRSSQRTICHSHESMCDAVLTTCGTVRVKEQ